MRKKPSQFWELLSCALHGHFYVGVDAAEITVNDELFVRDYDGLRWHRCLRCDDWRPFPEPLVPTMPSVPSRDQIDLPLRGPLLRDRYVLRLIAVDRAIHVLLLVSIATALFLFVGHRGALESVYDRIMNSLLGSSGGPSALRGFLGRFHRFFLFNPKHLDELGFAALGYAVLEATEMVGLWFTKRWAEYLTFVATALLLPLEIYELSTKLSVLKVVVFVLNLAIVIYLLLASDSLAPAGVIAWKRNVAMRKADGRQSNAPLSRHRLRGPLIDRCTSTPTSSKSLLQRCTARQGGTTLPTNFVIQKFQFKKRVVIVLVVFGLCLSGCGVVTAARKIVHDVKSNKSVIDAFTNKVKSGEATTFEATYVTTGVSPTVTQYAVEPGRGLTFKNTPSGVTNNGIGNLDVVVNPTGEYSCSSRSPSGSELHSTWSCIKLGTASATTENKIFGFYTPAHWVAFLRDFSLAAGFAGDSVTSSTKSVDGFDMHCVDFRASGVPGISTICTTAQGILGYVKVASNSTSFEIKSYSLSPPISLFELPPGAVVQVPTPTK